ncbi:MAG: hypothetical protein FWG78_03020 [Coriobacteriia bacterium]|nr:hypothetical protein [Coriobacteriia bacterium]
MYTKRGAEEVTVMAALTKDRVYTFRTYTEKIDAANAVLKSNNLDLPVVFNSVLDQIILTGHIPIKSREEIEAEIFIDNLQNDLTSRLQKMTAGDSISESEMRERFGA